MKAETPWEAEIIKAIVQVTGKSEEFVLNYLENKMKEQSKERKQFLASFRDPATQTGALIRSWK